MPNNEQQETTYPVYNQFIYKGPSIGWVMTGGGGGSSITINDNTVSPSTSTDLDELIINKLTKQQYNNITPNPDELYLITDDTIYAELSDLPQPSNTAPGMDGIATAGILGTYSRSDHIHPSDTSRVAKSGDTMTGDLEITTGALRVINSSIISPGHHTGIELVYDNNTTIIRPTGYSSTYGMTITASNSSGNKGIKLEGIEMPTADNGAANKKYVDDLVSSLGTVLNYKGIKTTSSALPVSGNSSGDVWLVSDDSSEYVWNGSVWEKLGPNADLSGLSTITLVDWTVNS